MKPIFKLTYLLLSCAVVGFPLTACISGEKDKSTTTDTVAVPTAPENPSGDSPALPQAAASNREVQSKTATNSVVIAGDVINVKDYGARGNGKTDDVAAINKALATGKSVYFPAGEYVISSGPLIVRNKKNIRIYGDGDQSWLRPPGQLQATAKKVYHTTFSIDLCSDVIIENLRIESRGENWGNADAGHKVASGDERSNWVIKNGGHAVSILRSNRITVNKVTGRFCGSTGVFYASSSDNIVFSDCFANAASLGYAGFAADNFADTRPEFYPGRKYTFNNCKVWAESSVYSGRKFSSKGAIVAEGDNKRILNIVINGGTFRDCGTGGDAKINGAAVSLENSNVTARNISASRNYMGIRIRNRGDIEQEVTTSFDNCKFLGNLVCGVYIASAHKGPGNITISNSTFTQAANSVWGFTKDPVLGESAGIIVQGYMSAQKIFLKNVDFSGGEKYLMATDKINLAVTNSRFSRANNSFEIYGGGDIDFDACDIEMNQQAKAHTYNYNKKYSSPMNLNFQGNSIKRFNQGGDYWKVISTSNVKKSINVQGMTANAPKQFATAQSVSATVLSYGLQGPNTIVIFSLSQPPGKTPTQAISSSNQTYKILQYIPGWENDPNKGKIFLANDVRKQFSINTRFILK